MVVVAFLIEEEHLVGLAFEEGSLVFVLLFVHEGAHGGDSCGEV